MQQLKVAVLAFLDQEGGPPPVKVTLAGHYAPTQVERVLVTMQAMIADIMTPEVIPEITCQNMEYRIKCFLAEFDLLDQQVKTEDSVPKIVSSFNFVCLLNLPHLTHMFGPLRNLWEGSYKGEGYIQHCKQFLRGGQRQNFAMNVVTHCLQETAYKRAADRLRGFGPPHAPETWGEFLSTRRGGYKVYGGKGTVSNQLSGNNIVSVLACLVRRKTGDDAHGNHEANGIHPYKLFCCVSAKTAQTVDIFELNIAVYELAPQSEVPVERMGGKYYHWGFARNNGSGSLTNLSEDNPFDPAQITFGVLLPLFCDRGVHSGGRHKLVLHSRYGIY